ncbi:hypothetical protein [Archangium lansingense]|uniref:Uncharacterized protein n=1 Tax=Archangium lansingense TaxID=2995310 RepID=A0ABT3ZZN5_9BACT|nr:hypothetical protein [Archangium lansinium]MCY1074541.1 hypothetical protein [Archangium lansinium]
MKKKTLSSWLGLTVGLVAGVVQAATPGNALFVLDNHTSMQDYPEYLPEAFTPGYYPTPTDPAPGDLGGDGSAGYNINTGCSDPALVAAMSWFDKDSSDPAQNGSVAVDADSDLGSSFFEPNQFYQSRGRRLGWQTEEYPYAVSADFRSLNSYGDAFSACYTVPNWSSDYFFSPIIDECMACLATKGWWRGPIVSAKTAPGLNGPSQVVGQPPLPPEAFRKWVISGRVLNVRPPKFVTARKALKDVLSVVTDKRLGVATQGQDQGWFDPPSLVKGMSPACDKSSPTIDEVALNRPALKSAVNNIRFNNPDRNLGEALFGLGAYFSSQVQDGRWASWFAQPINPGWGWPGCCDGGTTDNPDTGQPGSTWAGSPDEWLKAPYSDPVYGNLPGQPWEGTGNDKSICSGDQATSIVVLTDGTPRYEDNSVPITRMMSLLIAQGARHPDGTLVQFNPTGSPVGGINYCGDAPKLPSGTYTAADCDYTSYNWPTGLSAGNKNFMDDVAFFLSHSDLRGDTTGDQTVRTSVVGFGDQSPMLYSISKAGQGTFTRADTLTAIKTGLLNSL